MQNITQRRRPCEVELILEDMESLFPSTIRPTAGKIITKESLKYTETMIRIKD